MANYPLIKMLEESGYIIYRARFERVFDDGGAPISGHIKIKSEIVSGQIVLRGTVKRIFDTMITISNNKIVECACTCPDWRSNGARRIVCKHIMATAVDGYGAYVAIHHADMDKNTTTTTTDVKLDFRRELVAAIHNAVEQLSYRVETVLNTDKVPLLIGPTDTAKTSAVRMVAVRNNWGLEILDGMSSFADADLVGLRTNTGVYPSAIARAFARARAGETVLLFLDELTRFNQRALDVLMRPLLPVPVDVALGQRIPADEPVRQVEVPLWGLDWAPLSKCKIALACNPWGTVLDPALVRRTVPLEVNFDSALLSFFDTPARDIIEKSWQLVKEGQLPLPLGYTLLSQATSSTDINDIMQYYFAQLRAIDRTVAEGFIKLLEGLGVWKS